MISNDGHRAIHAGLLLEYASSLSWNIIGTVVIVIAVVRTGAAAFAGA